VSVAPSVWTKALTPSTKANRCVTAADKAVAYDESCCVSCAFDSSTRVRW
jgi:hypothetical protein